MRDKGEGRQETAALHKCETKYMEKETGDKRNGCIFNEREGKRKQKIEAIREWR